ncbi:MAG: hypothetical protein ACXW1W_18695, partial [Methylococcaceae bacterium]
NRGAAQPAVQTSDALSQLLKMGGQVQSVTAEIKDTGSNLKPNGVRCGLGGCKKIRINTVK